MVHCSVEAYCVLCRQAFDFLWDSRNQRFDHPLFAETLPIDEYLFCFLDIPNAVQTQPQHLWAGFLSRVDMRRGNWQLRNESLYRRLCESSIDLCSDKFCSSCRPLYHGTREGHLDGARLVKVARLLRHVAPWSVVSSVFHFELPLLLPDLSDICTETSLAALLNKIENHFPLELALQVLEQLSGLPKYMLAAKATTVYLARHLANFTADNSVVLTSGNIVNGGQISLQTQATLDGSCISHLESSTSAPTMSMGKQISLRQDQAIESIQVAFGVYGVVDFRFVYCDGTTSNWISDSKRRWVRNHKVSGLMTMETESDGMKLADIRPKDNSSPDILPLLWNTDLPISQNHRSVLFVLGPREYSIRNRPGYRLARYLSLENIRSLTLCFGGGGFLCAQADKDAQSALGSKPQMFCFSEETGCYFVPYHSCVTYFLAPGEVITPICVLTSGDKTTERTNVGPFFVALTSMQRTLFYAPYLLLRQRTMFSSFATAPTNRFCGLFTDPVPDQDPITSSIGATYEMNRDPSRDEDESFSIPNPHHPIPPSIDDWGEHSGFLNIVNFDDVSMIELQNRRERCIGLKITRHGGAIDVLGQWDGSVKEAITTIYETSQGPLRTLDFKMANPNDPNRFSWVSLIDVNRPGPAGDPEDSFRVDTLDADVAWYFNEAGDHVCYWDGTKSHYKMPRSSHLDAIQVQ